MDVDSDEPKSKAGKKASGKFSKAGEVLKKKQKTVFTHWDSRYLVLENN